MTHLLCIYLSDTCGWFIARVGRVISKMKKTWKLIFTNYLYILLSYKGRSHNKVGGNLTSAQGGG